MMPQLVALLAGGLALACRKPPEELAPPVPEQALAGLDRKAIPLALETTEGMVRCSIDGEKAPNAAAMVVGLARGQAKFRDPASGQAVIRPYYERMSFFRAIEGGLVQTGCPVGDGTGHPGYRIAVEADSGDAARLARPGALFLARYNPPPNREDPSPPPPGRVIGSQLVIGLTDMSHLAGKVTVLGRCDDLDVVARIATAVANKQRRVELVRAGVR